MLRPFSSFYKEAEFQQCYYLNVFTLLSKIVAIHSNYANDIANVRYSLFDLQFVIITLSLMKDLDVKITTFCETDIHQSK